MTRSTLTKTVLDPLSTTLQKIILIIICYVFQSKLPPRLKYLTPTYIICNTIIQNIEYINLRRTKSVKSNYQLAEVWNGGNFLGSQMSNCPRKNIVNDAEGLLDVEVLDGQHDLAMHIILWHEISSFFKKRVGYHMFLISSKET